MRGGCKRWRAAAAAAAILVAAAPGASACGVCVEDKIAAAYDHAVIERARSRGEVVVFAQVSGRGTAADFVGAAREAARRVPGVAARSVRAAEDSRSISFALDARVRSPAAALSAVERAASAAAVRLELLRVLR